MRRRWMLAVLALAAAAGTAAPAQQRDTGVPTETQERLARGTSSGFDWNWPGLLGLIGLLGLLRGHTEDGYHPAPLE